MQQELLKKHPYARLKVDVVWLPMLVGDGRGLIDQRVLSDPRVTYYWDPNRVVGNWFSQAVTQQPGTTWDAFFLYGAQATWDTTPEPLVASGSSIIGSRDELLSGFDTVQRSASALLPQGRSSRVGS